MDDDVGYQAEEKVCKVYDGEDHFTAFVQFLLAGLALASLWIKRLRERPRRLFWTWFLDVSKQALGASYAHVLNMVIAAVIAGNVRGSQELRDQCAWYAINYLIDTTLGLVLAILFLRLLDYVANERDWVSLQHSGVYHGTEGMVHWIHQLVAWITILTVVKFIILFFMWLTSGLLAQVGAILFAPLQSNIRIELLFVMIFFPGVMNIIYFWVTDSFLKAKKDQALAHEPEDEEVKEGLDSKKESLLGEDEEAITYDEVEGGKRREAEQQNQSTTGGDQGPTLEGGGQRRTDGAELI